MNANSNGNQDPLPLIGRALMATVFIVSGIGKLAAPARTESYIAAMGLPAPVLRYIVAIAVELGGGLLLLAGYRTKAIAAVLAAFCVVTAAIFHRALADQKQTIHSIKNLAMAGGLVAFGSFGLGRLALDRRNASNA